MSQGSDEAAVAGVVDLGTLRRLVADHARLAVDPADLAVDADLQDAGLSSFGSVQLMLAIEDEFDIEFPENRLNRGTFHSLATLRQAVEAMLTMKPRA